MLSYHKPVLLRESINGLKVKERPERIFVDVTFGGGGHSTEILNELNANGHIFGFDQDPDTAGNVISDPRFTFVPHNFRHLKRFLKLHSVNQVAGILADLGISSHQIDQAHRGFSTRFEGPLDMRMNSSQAITAADVVNTYSSHQLANIFSKYGELRKAKTLASFICQQRGLHKLTTTSGLQTLLQSFARHQPHKFFAKVFQALRIEVNQEMQALEEMLKQTLEVLESGGRLVVISYHSLEDRLVKNFMKTGNTDGHLIQDEFGRIERPFKLINKKVVTPSEEELNENKRSRSAKLRIAEKL